MDHSGMDMSSMVMTATSTGTAAMASSTATMDHTGMDMGGTCKISMLWNWYTIDSCFVSRSWHVTSKAMFAGSCIGVILLVVLLEFLRRAGKEYDRFIINQYLKSNKSNSTPASVSSGAGLAKGPDASAAPATCLSPAKRFRPSLAQQAVRMLLHVVQFAVAYFIMLLAMYYNGYIIICIFIGSGLGFLIFGWESFAVGLGGSDRLQEQVTVCCG